MADDADVLKTDASNGARPPPSSENGDTKLRNNSPSIQVNDTMAAEHKSPGEGATDDDHQDESLNSTPPLPPRPSNLNLLDERNTGSVRLSRRSSRPQLQARPTTALSLADVHTVHHQEATSSRSTSHTVSRRPSHAQMSRVPSRAPSEFGDTSSIKSYAPSVMGGPVESLMGEVLAESTPAWRALSAQLEVDNPFERHFADDEFFSAKFYHEFDPIETLNSEGTNEDLLLSDWKAKLKHFLILSSSGKPIWSRHGDDNLISSYVGIIQTLVSFYQGAKEELRGFTAGEARFVILSKGHLHLVAISKMGESDGQLRTQLDSLYMQILSTLTLPSMERMFINRPSIDLRRPLQGTEVLLDALADGFTRGSPSTLLSALECLKLRKSHRQIINNSLLKVRSPSLLYGLVVAGGRLVSVMRPKKHSLHPGDLQLIFNMLFEAGSVKAGGGENWIPLCLPGFNNTGFLYMYVSFINATESSSSTNANASHERQQASPTSRPEDEIALIFISANKEAFYELRTMRDELIEALKSNKSMGLIQAAVKKGHHTVSEILGPGTSIRHFLYKSRGNVQFTMPSYLPHFNGLVARRKLMSLYATLHANMHTKTAHLKVQHVVSHDAVAIAWETPLFELYCVAGPNATRQQLAQGANRVIQWIRREEERVFIMGGAVF